MPMTTVINALNFWEKWLPPELLIPVHMKMCDGQPLDKLFSCANNAPLYKCHIELPYYHKVSSAVCSQVSSFQLSGLFPVNQVYRKPLISLKRNTFVDHVLKI